MTASSFDNGRNIWFLLKPWNNPKFGIKFPKYYQDTSKIWKYQGRKCYDFWVIWETP